MKGRNMVKFQTLCRSAIVICIWNGFSALGTVYHSDGSAASVQGLLNQVLNGDTITIPAGAFNWTRGVTISKAITLQGAGVGNTIIKDAVNGTQLIQVGLVANNLTRITGIEFQDGGRSQVMIGILSVTGSNTNGSTFRWDNCKWYGMNGVPVINTVIGVIDHNTFDLAAVGPAIEVRGDSWNGAQWGDGSWTAATAYGSSGFLFIEDNNFTNHGGYFHGYTDAYGGARFVVRHNSIFNGEISNHGTESTGRPRGCRAVEVYNNTFTGTNIQRFVGGFRSGGLLFHDNNISGYQGDLCDFSIVNFRSFHAFTPWDAQGCSPCSTQYGADGTDQWDANDPTVYFSGTASVNSGDRTITVSGNPNWATNQWRGFTIRRTSNVCSSGSIPFSWIQGNTANTISYYGGAIYGGEQNLSFCTNDTLEIRKVNHALDQVGTAGGSLLNPSFTPTPPPGWNNQVVEPCYSWNNVNERGHPVNINAMGDGTPDLQPGARPNEHYFNDTPMPGYTPYTYPHPLVQGGQPSPTPTSTPAPTPTATATSTATPNPTPSPSPSATLPPSPTPTATTTATATPTATAPPRHTPKPRPSRPPR